LSILQHAHMHTGILARFIHYCEDNKCHSLYFLLLDELRLIADLERVPAKIDPNLDKFDYTQLPTMEVFHPDGTVTLTCRLCERGLTFPPNCYGHCVCCGLPNKSRMNLEVKQLRLDAAH
jgi:hypothetical protein